MLTTSARAFLTEQHHAVLSTFRRDGAAQLSIVTCGLWRDGAAFTTTEARAKLRNLRRDPRCSLLVSKESWWGYLVLEGRAVLLSRDNTSAEALRVALREVYQAAAGKEHPDWDDYDAAMVRERRAVVLVPGDRVYGPAA